MNSTLQTSINSVVSIQTSLNNYANLLNEFQQASAEFEAMVTESESMNEDSVEYKILSDKAEIKLAYINKLMLIL